MLNQLIEENKNLIYSIIYKYKNYCDLDDLFQTGVIGLIKAYKTFDENRNTKFSTHAYMYILSEILVYVNSNKAKEILTQKLMKEPSTHELSLFLEIDEKIITNILQLTKDNYNLESNLLKDGKKLCLLDTIKDDKNENMIDNLILKEQLESLTNEEKKLLWLRYYDDRTQAEVAEYLGTNQVSVSRNEKKVLKKIRNNLNDSKINC